MISSKKLDDLDFVLASFYDDDLLAGERRFIDSMVSFYSLFRECHENCLRSLAK